MPGELNLLSPFAPDLCTGKALRNQWLSSVPKVLIFAHPPEGVALYSPKGLLKVPKWQRLLGEPLVSYGVG